MQDFFIVGREIFYATPAKEGLSEADNYWASGLYKLNSDENLIPDLKRYSPGEYVNIKDGCLITQMYNMDTGFWQAFVIDEAGNVYRSGPDEDIKFITMYDGKIWKFI